MSSSNDGGPPLPSENNAANLSYNGNDVVSIHHEWRAAALKLIHLLHVKSFPLRVSGTWLVINKVLHLYLPALLRQRHWHLTKEREGITARASD